MNTCTLLAFLVLVLSKNLTSFPTLTASLTEQTAARIVNGYEVNITDVPYQAALRRRVLAGWAHMCGAVIISTKTLLTAAHCTTSFVGDPSSLRAVVGTAFRLSGGESYEFSRVIVHEYYSSLSLENDISLLVTSKQMSFGESVKAVNFASATHVLPVGTEAIVSGFGSVSYDGPASTVLLAARVTIVEQDTCARAYLRIADITTGMLCANATNPQRDACQGDSGGPLVANSTLVGIVSWGEGCADLTYPGVYTRISEYSSWILTYIES